MTYPNRFVQSLMMMMRRPYIKAALIILGFIYGACLLADVIAPYHYETEKREYSYAPPNMVQVSHQGQWVWPFVYGYQLSFDQYHRRVFTVDISKRYPVKFFHEGKMMTVPDGRWYVLGADSRGRDVFSRLLYGGRISLTIALIGALLAFGIGLMMGVISGYAGGIVDWVLMRLSDMLMILPTFYLMLAIRSGMPPAVNSLMVYGMVVLILALVGWASLARVIRGMTLSLKERDYVYAARLLKVPPLVIMLKHILPHTSAYALVAMSFAIPSYIMAEAGLSLIGLGIQDPIPSWGNMLSECMNVMVITQAPWLLVTGLLMIIIVMCFNTLAEGLRDAVDPLVTKS